MNTCVCVCVCGGGVSHFWVSICAFEKTPWLSGPKVEKLYSFLSEYSDKHPFLPHFIPGFCEKYSLFHIFVDFDSLIDWSE